MTRPFATLALAAAVLALAVLASQTRLARLANLRVPDDGPPAVYVQNATGDPSKCLVADRAAVTTRRSEPTLAGTSWKCSWPTGADGALAALSGKQPARLFVPFEQVDDPIHPWLYEAVREVAREAGVYVDGGVRDPDAQPLPPPLDASRALVLPRARWVQLWVDRQFRGLFLELRLPGKRFADARALGRVEFLAATGETLLCWNRKLEHACTVYTFWVAEGMWPDPAWRDDTAWLASLLEGVTPLRTFALAERAEPALLPWPLPLSLRRTLGAADDRRWSDPRFAAWAPPEDAAPSRALRDALSALDVASRLGELEAILSAHCAVRGCDAAAAQARLAASRSLAALQALQAEPESAVAPGEGG
ncbi:MAG: hypothetical protein AAGC60_01595 [Acidobacteriota bacterium]